MLFNVGIAGTKNDVAVARHILPDILLFTDSPVALADVLLTIVTLVEAVVNNSHR